MLNSSLVRISANNRRQILFLILGHFLWSCASLVFWFLGSGFGPSSVWLTGIFMALQLYLAAQLLLPALLIRPEERSRRFYLFWGLALLLSIWLAGQLPEVGSWQPLLTAMKSGQLLLIATLVGAALARYVRRIWEILPVCLMMTLADFSSWLYGPTAGFAQQIEDYYRTMEGPPPLIDMVLIKLAFPGTIGFAPVFGISDWIMVVFFALVAHQQGINDNLIGPRGEALAQQKRLGRYLPVSVVALFIAVQLAQSTGFFIPALPLIALMMLLWYAGRYLLLRRSA